MIYDYRQTDGDLIDVSALKQYASVEDLDISVSGSDTLIEFDADDSVLLAGFTQQLTDADFIFG